MIALAQSQGLAAAQRATSAAAVRKATQDVSAGIDQLQREENDLLVKRRSADETWANGLIIAIYHPVGDRRPACWPGFVCASVRRRVARARHAEALDRST